MFHICSCFLFVFVFLVCRFTAGFVCLIFVNLVSFRLVFICRLALFDFVSFSGFRCFACFLFCWFFCFLFAFRFLFFGFFLKSNAKFCPSPLVRFLTISYQPLFSLWISSGSVTEMHHDPAVILKSKSYQPCQVNSILPNQNQMTHNKS